MPQPAVLFADGVFGSPRRAQRPKSNHIASHIDQKKDEKNRRRGRKPGRVGLGKESGRGIEPHTETYPANWAKHDDLVSFKPRRGRDGHRGGQDEEAESEDEGTVDLQVEQEESGREGGEKGEKVERGEAAGGRVSLMDHYRGFGLHRMDVGISTWYVCMFFSSFAMPCTFVSLIFLYSTSFCSCFRSSARTFSLSRENSCIT